MNAEFARVLDIRHLPAGPQEWTADADECRRLAGRCGITAVEGLVATVTLTASDDTITATGRLRARIVQPCAISGEDFDVAIDEPVNLRFVPVRGDHAADEEVEIDADDCDEIEYEGLTFDLGEALAQTLALAIDPFAEGPEADRARAEHGLSGEAAGGAFAALSALKKQP
jgi:uncharacterized metal-binding protein YceD (DUF177 family)